MALYWEGTGDTSNFNTYSVNTISDFGSHGGNSLYNFVMTGTPLSLQAGQAVKIYVYDENGDPASLPGISTNATYLGSIMIGEQAYPVITYGSGAIVLSTQTINSTYTVGANPLCFLRGTQIDTPQGPIAVEDLAIGDTVMTASQGVASIRWIGRQRRNPRLCADDLPIRIAAGALGDGLPLRDLYVSPTHALGVEGCLVHAAALVNDRTIHQVSDWNSDIDYFHIETERHELIIAEGAPAETLFDNGLRDHFDNHADYSERHPHPEPMIELDLPRICYPRQLPQAIRRKLDAVADALWGQASRAA
jgi:hypothetical protein